MKPPSRQVFQSLFQQTNYGSSKQTRVFSWTKAYEIILGGWSCGVFEELIPFFHPLVNKWIVIMGGVVPTINNFIPPPEKPTVIQAGWVKITSCFLVQLITPGLSCNWHPFPQAPGDGHVAIRVCVTSIASTWSCGSSRCTQGRCMM